MLFYKGEKFDIELTQDAIASLPGDEVVGKAQLFRLIKRFADHGKLKSPDQMNNEDDGIYAIKAKQGLRAYGWYHKKHRGVFVISHFIHKKKQKLDPIDKEKALKNLETYETDNRVQEKS